MTLERRWAEHLARTSPVLADEAILREGAGLVRELAEELRRHPQRTLESLAPVDEALREAYEAWRLNLVRDLAGVALFDLAVETADVLRQIDPGWVVEHTVALVVSLAEAGRGADAVRVAQQNADANPDDHEAWTGLVEVQRVLGDDQAAEAALDHTVQVADEHAEFGAVGDLLARFGDEPGDDDLW